MARLPYKVGALILLICGSLLPKPVEGQAVSRPASFLSATRYAVVGSLYGSTKGIVFVASEEAARGSVVDTLPLEWNVATVMGDTVKKLSSDARPLERFVEPGPDGSPVYTLEDDRAPLASPLYVVDLRDFALGEKSFVIDGRGVVHSVRKISGRDDSDLQAFDCYTVKDYGRLFVRPFLEESFGKKTRFRSCGDLKRQIYQVEDGNGDILGLVAGRRPLR